MDSLVVHVCEVFLAIAAVCVYREHTYTENLYNLTIDYNYTRKGDRQRTLNTEPNLVKVTSVS